RLAAAGAIGTIAIPNPKAEEVPWSRTAGSRFAAKMDLDEPGSAPWPRLAMTANPERAEKLFAGSGRAFADLLRFLGSPEPLPRFPLAVRVRATTAMKRSRVRSENLAGLLRGSDPRLRDEVVGVSA